MENFFLDSLRVNLGIWDFGNRFIISWQLFFSQSESFAGFCESFSPQIRLRQAQYSVIACVVFHVTPQKTRKISAFVRREFFLSSHNEKIFFLNWSASAVAFLCLVHLYHENSWWQWCKRNHFWMRIPLSSPLFLLFILLPPQLLELCWATEWKESWKA